MWWSTVDLIGLCETLWCVCVQIPVFDECETWLNNYVVQFYTSGIKKLLKIDKHKLAKQKAREIDRGIVTEEKKVEAKSVVVVRVSDLKDSGLNDGELYQL